MRRLDKRETSTVFEQLESLGWLLRTPAPRPTDPWSTPGSSKADACLRVERFIHSFLFPHALAFYAGILGLADDHDRLAAVAGYVLAYKLTESRIETSPAVFGTCGDWTSAKPPRCSNNLNLSDGCCAHPPRGQPIRGARLDRLKQMPVCGSSGL